MRPILFLARPSSELSEGTGVSSSTQYLKKSLGDAGFEIYEPRKLLRIPPFRTIAAIIAYDYFQPLMQAFRYRDKEGVIVVVVDPAQALFLGSIRSILKKPIVVSIIHDLFYLEYNDSYHKYISYLYKKAIQHSDKIITTTQENEQLLHSHFGSNLLDVTVLPWGITSPRKNDISHENPYSKYKRDGLPTIGYLGSSQPRKRLHLLERILHKCQKAKIPITLLLGGPISLEWQNRLSGINSKSIQIEYLGQLTETDKSLFYLTIDAFIFPTEREGYGLPILESCYFRKPCIIFDSASIPQLFRNRCGILRDDLSNLESIIKDIASPNKALIESNGLFADTLDWANYINYFRNL